MSITEITERRNTYSLGHTPQEYERLRAQARIWEGATARVLDQVGVPRGGSCLDAGCGPGETMRMLAERVGPEGFITAADLAANPDVADFQSVSKTSQPYNLGTQFTNVETNTWEPAIEKILQGASVTSTLNSANTQANGYLGG